MAVSFSAAADSRAAVLTEVCALAEVCALTEVCALAEACASTEVFAAGFAAAALAETFAAVASAETEAAGPLADRLASPLPERRVGGEAVAPVAARVGLDTGLPAAALPGAVLPVLPGTAFAACAPVAASDAFVLLVVTAVILAL